MNMTLRMEFWSPMITYLFSPRIKDMTDVDYPTDSMLIPVFADVFNYDDLNLAPGWTMYSHASYRLDNANDSVVFKPILNESIIKAIDYHLKNSIPLVNLIDVKVRKQGELFINQRGYSFYTYTVVIAIDIGYINELISTVFHLE